MNPKIIMVPFSGKDSELGALETAAELAKKWNAHIEVWHIAPNPHSAAVAFYSIYGLGLTYIPDSLLVEIEKKSKRVIEQAQKKYHQFMRSVQIPETHKVEIKDGPTASFQLANGRADLILRMRARLADIVVISRGYTDELATTDNIVTDVVFVSGKPVLLVPAGKNAKPLNDKTMIAWNGSLQATRAMNAAMPFLKSENVWIATAAEKAKKVPVSAYEVERYLGHHGIHAKVVVSSDKNVKPAAALLQKTKALGVGLLVMGAYSHSRAREMILGGVTDHMLKKANIPVLFSH